MTNQVTKESKSNHKNKAITSLILGILSTIPIIILFSRSFLPTKLFFLSLFSIVGIVFGVKGLKSTKKNIAIAGIIFSTIGLFGLIILLFVWLGFATGM